MNNPGNDLTEHNGRFNLQQDETHLTFMGNLLSEQHTYGTSCPHESHRKISGTSGYLQDGLKAMCERPKEAAVVCCSSIHDSRINCCGQLRASIRNLAANIPSSADCCLSRRADSISHIPKTQPEALQMRMACCSAKVALNAATQNIWDYLPVEQYYFSVSEIKSMYSSLELIH